MSRSAFVLTLVALCVGLVDSWNIAVSVGDELRFYTHDIKTSTIRFQSRNLTALAYDEVHNTMIYVDKQTDGDTICSYDISGIENKCFNKRNGRSIHGIAYDPVTETVFFTDTNERSVNSISLKSGSDANVNLLVKMNEGIPRDIVVDSCKGYIYWLNTNMTKPTIEGARVNGTDRVVLQNITSIPVTTSYSLEPHSLAYDQRTQAIYCIEAFNTTQYRLYAYALNKQQKSYVIYYSCNLTVTHNNPSNTLAVLKESFVAVDFRDRKRKVWKYSNNITDIKLRFTINDIKVPVGIVANYKIKDQVQGIKHCDALSRVNTVMENYGGPFCVHGLKDNEQSICKCSPGYTGERCDVSVCDNYCLEGSCSFKDAGIPQCRCNAGYTGERCEVNMCHGYCLNDGDCSLDEEDEPACFCYDSYEGSRCEDEKNVTSRNVTLADLLKAVHKTASEISLNLTLKCDN